MLFEKFEKSRHSTPTFIHTPIPYSPKFQLSPTALMTIPICELKKMADNEIKLDALKSRLLSSSSPAVLTIPWPVQAR